MAGKGDKRRIEDVKAVNANWVLIDWGGNKKEKVATIKKKSKYQDIEDKLREYAKETTNNTLFNQLQPAIVNVFNWLISKQYPAVTYHNKQDILQSTYVRIVKYMGYYKPDKGQTAFSWLRNMISQEISLRRNNILNLNEYRYDSHLDLRKTDECKTLVRVNEMVRLLNVYTKTNRGNITKEDRKNINAIKKLLTKESIRFCSLNKNDMVNRIQTVSKQSLSSVKNTLGKIKEQHLTEDNEQSL